MDKAFIAICVSLTLSDVAVAQQKPAKEEIVGAWTLGPVTGEMDDGRRRAIRAFPKAHEIIFILRQA
jgi:hypothetical protein